MFEIALSLCAAFVIIYVLLTISTIIGCFISALVECATGSLFQWRKRDNHNYNKKDSR